MSVLRIVNIYVKVKRLATYTTFPLFNVMFTFPTAVTFPQNDVFRKSGTYLYWILANFMLTETSFWGYLTFLGKVNIILKMGNFVRIAKRFSFSEKFQFLKTPNCVGCYAIKIV